MLQVHKRCQRQFETSSHTVMWYRVGLRVLPIYYLESSLSVDRDRAQRWAKTLATL